MQELLERHVAYTGSTVAAAVLDDFDTVVSQHFVKVYPHEYARALRQLAAEKDQEDLLSKFEGTDALAALKQAADKAHAYTGYVPPPPQGKEIDWAMLLKDAADGWLVNKRAPTWDQGRAGKVANGTQKFRGFVEYERLALPYRDAVERSKDYGEVLSKLDSNERDALLNTQARPAATPTTRLLCLLCCS
jgi:hypothetical protein